MHERLGRRCVVIESPLLLLCQPAQLAALVAERYEAGGTTIWQFDDDELDCADALLDALPPTAQPRCERLAGSHLSPVAFALTPGDIDPLLGALLGGGRTLSLGDPAAIEALADALVAWIWPSGMAPPRALPMGEAGAGTAQG